MALPELPIPKKSRLSLGIEFGLGQFNLGIKPRSEEDQDYAVMVQDIFGKA